MERRHLGADKHYRDMLGSDSWLAIFDYDHWSTNPSTITGDMYCLVVVVNVDANKLAQPPCSPQLPKVSNEMGGVSRNPNYSTINVNHECMRPVYLRPCCQADI